MLAYLRSFVMASTACARHLQQFARILAPWGVFIAAGSLLVAGIGFAIDLSDRQSERHIRAWQLVFSVTGVSSSSVNNSAPDRYDRYLRGNSVRPALEYLNRTSSGLFCFDFLGPILDISSTDHRRRCIIPKKHRVSLAGLDLSGLNLNKIYLPFSRLEASKLDDAILTNANLEGTDLTSASLNGSDFTNSNLKGASLSWAQLDGAKVYGTDLQEANLSGATLARTMMNCSLKTDIERNINRVVCTDLRGAKGLSCGQLKTASQWCRSFRDKELACGASIPQPVEFGSDESSPLNSFSNCP